MLTKRDISFIHQRLSGEMATYASYAALGQLRAGQEQEHYKYLMALSDRLEEAEKTAPNETKPDAPASSYSRFWPQLKRMRA